MINMAFGELGANALRAENVDKVIKGLALQEFIIKNLFTVQTSGAWQESYYTESNTELSATAKVARLAAFPQQSPLWQKSSAYHQKHGLEVDVSIEDELADNIDVISRSQLRIARAIAKSVDTLCYNTLSSGAGLTQTIGNSGPNDAPWDSPTRADRHPLDAILAAKKQIGVANYRADTLLLNEYDYSLLLGNEDVLDAFSPTQNVVQSGVMGAIAGLNVVVSNSVAPDTAFVMESGVFGTYRQISPLTTNTEKVPGIKTIIRGWEIGVPFITDPSAVCKISNTNV